jgi:hypothetical protein
MPINYVRVIHQQTVRRSILLDKIDRAQGNSEGYARVPKQKLYVPYSNPNDTAVKGYVDLVPTDEVLLSQGSKGTIAGLVSAGRVTSAVVASNLVATPVITNGNTGGTDVTINGTTFTSVSPDLTYVILTNNVSGASQTIPQSAFTSNNGTTIVLPDSAVTIGTPAAGWTARVKANSKLSNTVTLT